MRRVLLEVSREKYNKGLGHSQVRLILGEAAEQLGINDTEEQAFLTAWADLFREGLLAWGYNLENPIPPYVHLTETGRQIMENLSRDPYNPDGYMAYIRPILSGQPIAESYIEEAVRTFQAGYFKAAAVMVGAAAEVLVLNLRGALVQEMSAKGHSVPSQLRAWQVRKVRDAIWRSLEPKKSAMGNGLYERFSGYWQSISDQIRLARNDAGHPENLNPVAQEQVYASLVLFPELAKLVRDLKGWIATSYTP